jgi:phage tail sheath protein FI
MPQDLKAGMVSYNGLVPLFGITGSNGTSETETGLMTVSSLNNWLGRLSDSQFSTSGPTGAWANEWFSVWNYLQYGGSCVVGGTGSTGAYYTQDGTLGITSTILHNNNQVQLDIVFDGGNTLSSAAAASIAQTRTDCLAVVGNYKDISSLNLASAYDGFTADFGAKNISEYVVYVAGRKKFTYVSNGVATVYEGSLSPDVAGCFARTAKTDNIWVTPAGYVRGRILNVLYMTQKFSDSDANYFAQGGVNAIYSLPGEGTFLLSNLTSNTSATSAKKQISNMMLSLYLQKQLISVLKRYLFTQNNASTRQQVINSSTPILDSILANGAISSYLLTCDESNNTAAVVAAGNLILDVTIGLVVPATTVTVRVINSATGEVIVS